MPLEFRPSQALRLWRDVTFDLVLDGRHDLSARQMAVLLTVYLEPPPHTVRGLAEKLGVTKPVITRALDSMGRLGLLTRRRDEVRPPQRPRPADPRRLAGGRAPRRRHRRPLPRPAALALILVPEVVRGPCHKLPSARRGCSGTEKEMP